MGTSFTPCWVSTYSEGHLPLCLLLHSSQTALSPGKRKMPEAVSSCRSALTRLETLMEHLEVVPQGNPGQGMDAERICGFQSFPSPGTSCLFLWHLLLGLCEKQPWYLWCHLPLSFKVQELRCQWVRCFSAKVFHPGVKSGTARATRAFYLWLESLMKSFLWTGSLKEWRRLFHICILQGVAQAGCA